MRRVVLRAVVIGMVSFSFSLAIGWVYGARLLGRMNSGRFVDGHAKDWPREAPAGWSDLSDVEISKRFGARRTFYSSDAISSSGELLEMMEVQEFGWPFFSVGTTSVYGGGYGADYGLLRHQFITLPTKILWGGLVMNAALYGLTIGAVLYGPGTVRRVCRRRRGACEGCGYDLRGGGGVCPECGQSAS